jgi:hypothetical protein
VTNENNAGLNVLFFCMFRCKFYNCRVLQARKLLYARILVLVFGWLLLPDWDSESYCLSILHFILPRRTHSLF